MTDSKASVLKVFGLVKDCVTAFTELSHMMPHLDEAIFQNVNVALSELMKCVKHAALIQGDITGKELMPENFIEKPEIPEGAPVN